MGCSFSGNADNEKAHPKPNAPEGETDVWLEVLFRELPRSKDLDALMSVNHKQMPITATHDFRVSGKRTGDEDVVIRLLAD